MRGPLYAIAGLFFAAALLLALAGDSMALKASAFAVFGVACVIGVSLAFLAVGRAEDAERRAATAARRAPDPDPHPEPEPGVNPHAGEAARRSRSRPPRRPPH